MKFKKLLFPFLIVLCFFIAACGSSSSSSSSSSNDSNSSSNSKSTSSKTSPFELYNKVTLGMTKEQVDSTLGITAKSDNSGGVPNAYDYMNNDYGVYVTYNNQNQACSKTVVGIDYSTLGEYTSKTVTEAECDKIKSGMTKDDVTKILGCDGIECSRTATQCMTTSNSPDDFKNSGIILRWGNKNGKGGIQVVMLSNGTVSNALYSSGNY